MTTYWVSSSAKGGADGSSYEDAIGTLPGGIALCTSQGDILNVIADGDHTWPTSETDIPDGTTGTSFSDYGVLIRGVADDATEDPALASIVASGGDAVRYFFLVKANTGYVLARNLEFDATGKDTDVNAYYTSRLWDNGAPNPGPIRFEGCSFLGGATGVDPDGIRLAFGIRTAGPPAGTAVCEIEDCYFQNWDDFWSIGATLDKSIIGCVIFNDVATGGDTFITQTLGAGTGGELIFTNNTFYQSIGNNVFASPLIYQVAAGLNAGVVNVKDNLVFFESSNAVPLVHLFADSGPGDGSFTGTIDYNALTGGPTIVVGDLHGEGWYHDLWDTVAHANDQVAYVVAEATIFLTPASTYAWDALGNGVEITILKDMRPKLYLTDSSTGGVIGALVAGQTDLSVTNLSDRNNPRVDETVIFTITASNNGSDDSGVEVAALLPSGLTLVSASPGTGSYDSETGVWTIGDLADAGAAIMTIRATVDSDQAGNTITYTVVVSGDLVEAAADNNTAARVLSVVDSTVIDPGGDDTVPVIDTYPIYAPDLKFNLNMWFEIKKNRKVFEHIRKDVEGERWVEMLTRRIVLATNTTTNVNLGGIQRGEFMLIESDVAVQVGIGFATAKLWPASKAVALLVSDFETVQIKNPSTTDEASILMVVSD